MCQRGGKSSHKRNRNEVTEYFSSIGTIKRESPLRKIIYRHCRYPMSAATAGTVITLGCKGF
jgi:hypothetical protein